MKKITIIMKTTNNCNLQCKHCYETENQFKDFKSVMTLDVLENTIKKVQAEYQKIIYIWFGGEPLLAGLNFFEKAIEYQKLYNHNNTIQNRIQTNGIKLSDEFIEFFKKNLFNVSISFDGLYNDFLRYDSDLVLDRIQKCKSKNLHVNIISTICSKTSDKQIENYNYFKKQGLFMKFNPIFPAGAAKKNSKYLLDEKKYIIDTKNFFKYWINDDTAIPVSSFVQYAKMYLGYKERNCIYGACLYKVLNIEPNGVIFPCSRYYKDEHMIGNVFDFQNISEAFKTQNFNKIVFDGITRRNKCKKECKLYEFCLGGCSSACANEVELSNNNTQLCRITKEILPFVFNEFDIVFKIGPIKNPILQYLKKQLNNTSDTISYKNIQI